jgi:hypothetical protein
VLSQTACHGLRFKEMRPFAQLAGMYILMHVVGLVVLTTATLLLSGRTLASRIPSRIGAE